MTAESEARPERTAPSPVQTWLLLFRHLLRAQLRRSRLLGLGGLALLIVLVGVGVARGDTRPGDGVEALNQIALSIVIPLAALIVASATLGDLVEDRSLVYLVRSPAPLWILASAAWAVSVVVVVPLSVIAPAVAGAVTGDDGAATGMAVAGAIAAFAYCGIFLFLGLVTKRAVVWGLVYILIWEQFAANAGSGLARLAVLSYTRSLLSDATDVSLRLADRSVGAGLASGPLVALVAIGLTARALSRNDVD